MITAFLEALGTLSFLLVIWVILRAAALKQARKRERKQWVESIRPGKGLGV